MSNATTSRIDVLSHHVHQPLGETYKVRIERRRGFQPPWYSVKVYTCQCGRETHLSIRGSHMPGAIRCDCGNQLPL